MTNESIPVDDTSSQQSKRALLGETLLMGPVGLAERQELRGQQSLTNSTCLPIKGSEITAFTAMGVKFIKPDDDTARDDLFRTAILPDGWTKRPTDHSMWSELVDDRGRVRGMIFYKASTHDRQAKMHIVAFFNITTYDSEPPNIRGTVTAGGTIVHQTPPLGADCPPEAESPLYEEVRNAAEAWVKEHYPEYEDVMAYWDTPDAELYSDYTAVAAAVNP